MKSITILQEDLDKFCFHMHMLSENNKPPLEGNIQYLTSVMSEISTLLGINISLVAHDYITRRKAISSGGMALITTNTADKTPLVIFPISFINEVITLLESQISVLSEDTSILVDIKNRLKKFIDTTPLTGVINDE